MIIRLKKANFSSNNIGQYTTEPGTLTFNVSPSNASWTLTCAAMSPSTKTGTGNTTWANIPAGSTVSYEVSLSGYNTQKGSISIYGNTSKTITLSEVGSVTPPVTPPVTPEKPGTGGGSGETPSIPTTETWYVDHRNNVSKFVSSVNIAGRGWCHVPKSNAYNAIVGRPINTIGIITNLESQNITIGVVTYKGSETDMRTIGTYTLTNPNGTTKSFVSCKIDEVTLNDNECLALYAQTDDNIQFYYASSGGPIIDANGIADGNFAGRVPKVYGSGNAWTEYTNNLTLGISYGYIPE